MSQGQVVVLAVVFAVVALLLINGQRSRHRTEELMKEWYTEDELERLRERKRAAAAADEEDSA